MVHKKLCNDIMCVLASDIRYDGIEVVIDEMLELRILACGKATRRMFNKSKDIVVNQQVFYKEGIATFRANPSPEQTLKKSHPLFEESIDSFVDLHRNRFNATIKRYSASHDAGEPIPMIRDSDEIHLSLNSAVWSIQQMGAKCVLFYGTTSPWELLAVDPAKLRCVSKNEVEEINIQCAAVQGCYTTSPLTQDLFIDPQAQMIDVNIRIEHDCVQVRHRISIAEAQKIWIGFRRLTCRVRRKNGGISEVDGDISLTE